MGAGRGEEITRKVMWKMLAYIRWQNGIFFFWLDHVMDALGEVKKLWED